MMSILFTLYTLLGVFAMGMVVVNLILDNIFTKFHKRCMCVFPIHSAIILLICWISYSTAHYFDKKRNGGK